MYPKVYEDYLNSIKKDGDFRHMGSDIFFHGLEKGETCEITLEEGKKMVIKLTEIHSPDDEGMRELDFEVNGNRRVIKIKDINVRNANVKAESSRIANDDDPNEVGANIPGNIVKVLVGEGDHVDEGEPIAVIEGQIKEICVKEGQQVKAGQLVAVIEQ